MDTKVGFEGMNMTAAAGQIGDRWALLILWEAMQGTTRFKQFHRRLGIARSVLSARLNKLDEEGILEKCHVFQGGQHMQYWLTNKGAALRPALKAMDRWGERWGADTTRR